MAPEGRTNGADARAAGSFLPPELAPRAADFTLVLGLMRARAQTAQIPARSFMQQVRIHLGAKYGVGELHLPDLLAIQIDYIHDRHNLVSFSSDRSFCSFLLRCRRAFCRRATWLLGVFRAAN